MRFGSGGILILLGLALASSELTACAEQTNQNTNGGLPSGELGTGGAASGCDVDGKRLDIGESFGACNECTCNENGEVLCALILCNPDAGGSPGAGGAAGTDNAAGSGGAR